MRRILFATALLMIGVVVSLLLSRPDPCEGLVFEFNQTNDVLATVNPASPLWQVMQDQNGQVWNQMQREGCEP